MEQIWTSTSDFILSEESHRDGRLLGFTQGKVEDLLNYITMNNNQRGFLSSFYSDYWTFYAVFQEYNLADFQCFSRYLDMFGDIKVDEVTDVDVFKATYFPLGFSADNAGYTVNIALQQLPDFKRWREALGLSMMSFRPQMMWLSQLCVFDVKWIWMGVSHHDDAT